MKNLLVYILIFFLSTSFASNLSDAEKLHKKGQTAFKQKKYSESFKLFSKEISIRKKLNDSNGEALANIYAASALQRLSKYSKSKKYLKSALTIGLESKNYNIIGTCYGMLATSYRETGDEIKASEYYTNYLNFSEHVENQQLKGEIQQNKALLKEVESVLEETEEELEETEEELKVAETIAKNRKLKVDLLKKEKQLQEINLDKKNAIIKSSRMELENEKLLRNYFIGGIVFLVIILVLATFGYIQKRKDNNLIKEQKEKIVDSINYALNIQQAMLPEIKLFKNYFKEFFILYKPVDIVSGDFYFLHEDKENKEIYVAVADCTGHGVPGAMLSMICNNALSDVIFSGESKVNLILDKVHLKIIEALNQNETNNKDGMDVSICKINFQAKKLEFAGAGNSLAYVQNGKINTLKSNKRPVGGVYKRNMKPFTLHELEFNTPTTIYLTTDGFSDQFGGQDGRKYYKRNLYKDLEKNHSLSLDDQKELLLKSLKKWKGNHPQIDDISIMGIRL